MHVNAHKCTKYQHYLFHIYEYSKNTTKNKQKQIIKQISPVKEINFQQVYYLLYALQCFEFTLNLFCYTRTLLTNGFIEYFRISKHKREEIFIFFIFNFNHRKNIKVSN